MTMVWPAWSPDLSPLEHLWGYLKRRLTEYEHPPNWIHELWKRSQVEQEKVPAEECQKLIESMPRRIQAVLEQNEAIPSTGNIQIPYSIQK